MEISEIIDRKLLDEQIKKSQRARSGKWNPSSFGRCYRYQFWNRKNKPHSNPVGVNTLRIFKVGELFHNFVQQFFTPEQREIQTETEDILGFADIVLETEVIDIKSIRSFAFKLFKKKDYDITVDKYDNILQLMVYVWLLKKEAGRLVYIDKDTLEIKEFIFNLPNWIDKVKEELEILQGYWKQDKLPPPLARVYNGKECNYCVFQDTCYGLQGKNNTITEKGGELK